METDAIVEIAKHQERYFGGAGQMLLPSQQTVTAALEQIPQGRLLTTDQLRKQLAQQFGVRGTCPVTTRKALQAIAASSSVAYWRVVKQNGGLLSQFPGGVDGHAQCLQQEGFEIDRSKNPKVRGFKRYLVKD